MTIAMQLTAAAVLAASANALEGGWTQYVGGNECQYKLVEEQASWFHAVRHCYDNENMSELALVQSEDEARFISALGGKSSPRWVFGYFDETSWNKDYNALNLWHAGQPGNPNLSAKHCAVQGGDDDEKHLLSAESCSVKSHSVCKLCPSKEASEMVVRLSKPVQSRRRNRRGVSSSTTTDAPAVVFSTTTTDAPDGDDSGSDAPAGTFVFAFDKHDEDQNNYNDHTGFYYGSETAQRLAARYGDNFQINQWEGGAWDEETNSWVGGAWGGNANGLLSKTQASEWVGPQCAQDELGAALIGYGMSGVMEKMMVADACNRLITAKTVNGMGFTFIQGAQGDQATADGMLAAAVDPCSCWGGLEAADIAPFMECNLAPGSDIWTVGSYWQGCQIQKAQALTDYTVDVSGYTCVPKQIHAWFHTSPQITITNKFGVQVSTLYDTTPEECAAACDSGTVTDFFVEGKWGEIGGGCTAFEFIKEGESGATNICHHFGGGTRYDQLADGMYSSGSYTCFKEADVSDDIGAIGGEGAVQAISAGVVRSTASTGTSSFTLTTGAVMAIVLSTIVVLVAIVQRRRTNRAANIARNGEGFIEESFPSFLAIAASEDAVIGEMWDNTDLE